MQRDDHMRTQGEDGVYMRRREASGDTSPAHAWTSGSWAPGREALNVCCVSPHVCVVMSPSKPTQYCSRHAAVGAAGQSSSSQGVPKTRQ